MSIRKATAADLRAIGETFAAAFADDELFGLMMHPYRKEYPEDYIHFWEHKIGKRMLDSAHEILVALDGERGKIVGGADWHGQGKAAEGRTAINSKTIQEVKGYLSVLPTQNRASDPSKMDALDSSIPLIAHYWTGHREDVWDLSLIAVHPDFEGQGIGKQLVMWGLNESKKQGIGASVIAADEKDTWYERFGYKKVGMANVGALAENGMKGGTIMFIDP